MDALLTLSFDNLSARDSHRTRKGLRQIEGLLAQICLSNSSANRSPHKRKSSKLRVNQNESGDSETKSCKRLSELRRDAAFREFFRLQEGFRWNVATRLLDTLTTLMGQPSPTHHTNTLILSTLTLLQGTLLLHPTSRTIFARQDPMNLLLDLLDASNPSTVQAQALLVLVTALLDSPANTRCFESLEGLLTVTSLFKSRTTRQEVKMRTLEFLYFYLMPEAPRHTAASAPQPPTASGWGERRGSMDATSEMLVGAPPPHVRTLSGNASDGASGVRSTEAKQRLLGRHLSNVDELVRDLSETAVFAEAGGVEAVAAA